jgi:hypothetical protein
MYAHAVAESVLNHLGTASQKAERFSLVGRLLLSPPPDEALRAKKR